MLRIDVIDPRDLPRYRDAWNALVEKMTRPCIFCTWEWVYGWWCHFGEDHQPLFLFMSRGADLVGILPLVLSRRRLEDRPFPGRILTFCGSLDLHADHLDIIAAPEDAIQCLERFLIYVRSEHRGWDVAHFSHLADDSQMIAWADRQRQTESVDVRPVSAAASIRLPATYSDFEKGLPGRRRRYLKRMRRVLFTERGVTYRQYQPSAMPDGIRLLVDLHGRRAQRKRMKTTFSGDRLIRFHEDVATRLYPLGWVRLRFLYAGDQPIAGHYCFAYQGRFFDYQRGLDPEWEQWSTGNVLLLELIREACEEGATEFDLLRGDHAYKNRWTSFRRVLSDVDLYNATGRARLLRWTGRLRSRAVASLRAASRFRGEHAGHPPGGFSGGL